MGAAVIDGYQVEEVTEAGARVLGSFGWDEALARDLHRFYSFLYRRRRFFRVVFRQGDAWRVVYA